MTDIITKQRLYVSRDGTAGPYITVPLDQLDEVRQLLSQHSIRYWVDEHAISMNGKPYVTVVDLGRGTDADAVQAILDGAG
jgi:hypothetical protein